MGKENIPLIVGTGLLALGAAGSVYFIVKGGRDRLLEQIAQQQTLHIENTLCGPIAEKFYVVTNPITGLPDTGYVEIEGEKVAGGYFAKTR